MKSLFSFFLMFFSVSAMATNFSFTYFGNEAGTQSYYACSYVEDQAQSYLELLGATHIDVRCSGGITSGWNAGPVTLNASFDLPVVTNNDFETLEISGDFSSPACGLNVRIIKEILKSMAYIQVIKREDACAFSTSNYYYKLRVPR
jgi:hypothetical protein